MGKRGKNFVRAEPTVGVRRGSQLQSGRIKYSHLQCAYFGLKILIINVAGLQIRPIVHFDNSSFLIPNSSLSKFFLLFPCTVRCLYISFFSSFCSFCEAKRFFILIGHITNGRPYWPHPIIIMLIVSISQFCYMEV